MFEDFFTTYSMVEPPKVYKDNPDLAIREIKNIKDIENILPLNILQDDIYSFEDYPGITSPFEGSQKVESVNNSPSNFSKENTKQKKFLKSPKTFDEAFQQAITINPEVSEYKDFLVKLAKKESNFNSYIQNTAGAPYYGYFQMGKEEIKKTTGLSVEEFRKDPVQQILGAVKLYKMNLKTMKAIGIYNIGKEKGYSDDALVAGAWLGGPGGVKKYLKGLGDPSDSHWYKNGKGTSVGIRMKEFNE